MCVAIAPCADRKFSPGAASSYANHQTNDNVTVAAEAYDTDGLAHSAFGKVNPYQYGVLPVLVIIQNDTDKAIRLDSLQVEYTEVDGGRVEPTPMQDVKYVGSAPKKPQPNTGSPIPPGVFKKKNPLSGQEIPERAFLARMLPPHEAASGFFYFQAKHRPGAKLYLTGMTEAQTGKGFVYFEIGLDTKQ
jgi:hypothetical protein